MYTPPSAGAVASITEEDDMGVKKLPSRPFSAAPVDSTTPGDRRARNFADFVVSCQLAAMHVC